MLVLVLLLGGGVYGVYWILSQQVEHTKQALRTAEDSSRTNQLQAALDRAQQALGQQLAIGETRRAEA